METAGRIFKARWSQRRPGWNDNYCLQFTTPTGMAVGIGSPTLEGAMEYAQAEFARMNDGRAVLVIPPYRGHAGDAQRTR